VNRAERRRTTPTRTVGGDRRRIILFATLGVVAVLIVAGVILGSRTASVAPTLAQLKVGESAPAFSVSTTAGPFAVPTTDRKPTVLEVFATWCPHCQHEVVTLNSLYQHYGAKANVVAVSGNPQGMDGHSPESQADVMTFVQRFKTKYPVAFDPELKVMNEYLQGGYPTIVVIGPDNKIRAVHDGEVEEKTLAKDIDDALKG
jgi:peroxiredoxin